MFIYYTFHALLLAFFHVCILIQIHCFNCHPYSILMTSRRRSLEIQVIYISKMSFLLILSPLSCQLIFGHLLLHLKFQVSELISLMTSPFEKNFLSVNYKL